jgi:mannosyl-oligosaccharide alpha-1,3-glucosidase
MYVDVSKPASGASTQWIAESGVVDLFLLIGPRPADVSAQYATFTGGSAMPQLFALGCALQHRGSCQLHGMLSPLIPSQG